MRLLRAVPLWCVPGGRILDLGTGLGPNALFFANLGFRVDAIDSSAPKIEALVRDAATRGLAIEARTLDICSPEIELAQYDAVIATFVLHFLDTGAANDLLARARTRARPGAVHAIGAITSQSELADAAPPGKFYPAPDEVEESYRADGWMVHEAWKESRDSMATRADGTRLKNTVAFVLARRR